MSRLLRVLAGVGRGSLLRPAPVLPAFWRVLSSSKPPKGFEKFYEKDESGEKQAPSPPPPVSPLQHGIAVGVLLYALYSLYSSAPREEELTFQSFLSEFFYKGYVERVQVVNRSFARVYIRSDGPPMYAGRSFKITLGSVEQFEGKLDVIQSQMGMDPVNFVPVQYVEQKDWSSELLRVLPSLLLLIPLMLVARSVGAGMKEMGGKGDRSMFSFRKAFPVAGKDLKQKTKFADVAGLTQAKQEIMEFVEFLKHPAKFNHLGAKIPKGALLVGPPGTGKTLLAKAVAGEAGVPFYSMSGSDFIEMFVGVGSSRVRDLFAQARKTAPSIVFIDEIDAIGRKRGKGGFGGGNDERENTLNQLLVEMDGFTTSTGVVVLAGTNRADILDPALLRPGRFDRTVPIDKPDLEERGEIFLVHLKKLKLSCDKEEISRRMAALTPGMAGADIANICNEAAIFAARRNGAGVEQIDFENACDRVLGGLTKNKNLMTPAERKTVALHESGHAVAGWFLENADPLLKVSIVPRSSGALGFAQYLPEELSLYSKQALLDKICVILSGRASEEVFVGKVTTGASDDFEKVTNIAYGMVQTYGMSDVGMVAWNPENLRQYQYKPFSELTAQKIDAAVKNLIDEQFARSKELLSFHKERVLALSERLFLKETVMYDDLKEVLGPRQWPIKTAYRRFVDTANEPAQEPNNETETNKVPI